MRRLGWATAVVALLVVGPATLALAVNPNYRSVIEKVTPSVPGISARVRESDDFIELRDRGGHEVTIYGYEREPYARILRNRTVQVNQRSPATYLDTGFSPTGPVPAKADPKAPPQWKTQSHDGTFTWFDHRTHYLAAGVPTQVKDPSRQTKIFDYEVPLRVDGRKGAIDGTLFWAGDGGASKLPIVVGGIAVVVTGLAGLALVARRRRGGRGGDDSGGERQPATEVW
ncbi:MAG TPA: hypothetical protein VII45_01720 [Solirubrobacterales bacterium]